MTTDHIMLLGAMLALPMGVTGQDSASCFEFVVTSGEWSASASDPEPTHPFDSEFFFTQAPARFVVTDSLTRLGARAMRPLTDPGSQFRPGSRFRMVWSQNSDELVISWGTGFGGWAGEFTRAAEDASAEWVGSVASFSDDIPAPGERRGQWTYLVEVHPIPCSGTPARDLFDS